MFVTGLKRSLLSNTSCFSNLYLFVCIKKCKSKNYLNSIMMTIGKRYIMVVVDDFTRYTWVILLRSKSDAPEHIEALCTRLQNEKSLKIDRI